MGTLSDIAELQGRVDGLCESVISLQREINALKQARAYHPDAEAVIAAERATVAALWNHIEAISIEMQNVVDRTPCVIGLKPDDGFWRAIDKLEEVVHAALGAEPAR